VIIDLIVAVNFLLLFKLTKEPIKPCTSSKKGILLLMMNPTTKYPAVMMNQSKVPRIVLLSRVVGKIFE
jgi:hypothetical protein